MLLVVLLIFVLLIQIANIFISNVTYDWSFIAMLFAGIIIFALLYVKIGYWLIKKDFENKKYIRVISKQNCYLAKHTALKNSIYYMVAISYLENNDINSFSKFVDKIDGKDWYLSKCFLNIIYAIIIGDNVLETKWKDNYSNNSESPLKFRYDEILVLLQKSRAQKCDWSSDEMKSIESIKIDAIKNLIVD